MTKFLSPGPGHYDLKNSSVNEAKITFKKSRRNFILKGGFTYVEDLTKSPGPMYMIP